MDLFNSSIFSHHTSMLTTLQGAGASATCTDGADGGEKHHDHFNSSNPSPLLPLQGASANATSSDGADGGVKNATAPAVKRIQVPKKKTAKVGCTS